MKKSNIARIHINQFIPNFKAELGSNSLLHHSLGSNNDGVKIVLKPLPLRCLRPNRKSTKTRKPNPKMPNSKSSTPQRTTADVLCLAKVNSFRFGKWMFTETYRALSSSFHRTKVCIGVAVSGRHAPGH